MRNTEVKVQRFEYQKNVLPLETRDITSENLSEIDISKSYDLIFVYIPKESNIDEESINKYCSENDIMWNAICDRKGELQNYILDKPIEEYIKDSLEKLIFKVLFLNE